MFRTTMIFAVLMLAVACARQSRLEPAPAANKVAEDTVLSKVEGVTVTAKVDEWPGDAGILEHVTPVWVQLRNSSDKPLRVQYSQFALIAPDGRRFSALPPFRIEGSVAKSVNDYDPVAAPGFEYSGFELAPAYAGMYQGLAVYDQPFEYDPLYYGTYYTYLARVQLPTAEMLRRAIPEGTLQPGGHVEGFFYFEKITGDPRRVTFHADLVNARNSNMFGLITIPFTVQG